MSGTHPARMRQPDTSADPIIEHALDTGYLDSDAAYDVPGAPDHQAAVKAMTSICRSARRRNLSPAAWVAGEAGEVCRQNTCPDPAAPHMVRFKLWSRDKARVHVYRKSGGRPENLRFNPWAGGGTRQYDDSGSPR